MTRKLTYVEALQEAAYSDALTAVAQGMSRNETQGELLDVYTALSTDQIQDVMADAYEAARKSGVEREDIDPSWHTS